MKKATSINRNLPVGYIHLPPQKNIATSARRCCLFPIGSMEHGILTYIKTMKINQM